MDDANQGLRHATPVELEAGLEAIRRSPVDGGSVELIVRRPGVDQRDVLEDAALDPGEGLVGDGWLERARRRRPERAPDPDTQLTLMNARVAALVAGGRERWPLAGDQLFVDLDLSIENLPPGTRLAIGSAVVEVSAQPHTGCAKFSARFGSDAMRFVNSDEGQALRLRGANARVVEGGIVRVGDTVRRL